MVKQLDIDVGCFNILTPFPGTKLFDRINKEKRIISYDWTLYTCAKPVFKPKHMTPEQLLDGALWVLNEYYSIPSTTKRVVKNLHHGIGAFKNSLLGNFLFYARKFDPGRN